MNRAHLIKMANQIGAFFEAMPDQAQAVAEEAQLKPVVRDALVTLGQSGGDL